MAYDVIVAGGGVSGCAAAVAAARNGAKTLLLERYGFPGGALTNAGVGPMMSFHAGGEQAVMGLAQEVVDRLCALGGAIGHIPDTTGYVPTVTPFEPEVLKRVLDDMLAEAGCEVRLHSFVCGADAGDGRIRSVTVADKRGLEKFCAKAYIDATGDGDLAAASGAEFALGRTGDGLCQPMTTNFRVTNADTARIVAQIRKEPENFNIRDLSLIDRAARLSVAGFYRQFDAAKKAGRLTTQREDVLMFESVNRGDFVVNTSRVIRMNPVDPEELSRAEREGRKQCAELFEFLKREISGFENARLMGTGPQIGVRESRHVLGEYLLTAEDLLDARKFEDSVARGAYPIDIHNPTGASTRTVRLKEGESYRIPYRALVAKDFRNLWICGRCLSATHEASAAVRVTPIAMATGQAAGTAAALSARENADAQTVPISKLRETLTDQRALI